MTFGGKARRQMQIHKLALAMALMAGPVVAGPIFYSNIIPANDTMTDIAFTAGPYDGIGDSVTFSGPVTVDDALLELFNTGSAGTFDASLAFYQVGSPVASQIGSAFTMTGNSAAANSYVGLDFQLNQLALPTSTVFILQLSNVTSGVVLGEELYSGTTAGTNTPGTAIVLQGAAFSQIATPGGNPGFNIEDVPEPGTLLFLASGLALCLWRSRRAV